MWRAPRKGHVVIDNGTLVYRVQGGAHFDATGKAVTAANVDVASILVQPLRRFLSSFSSLQAER